MVWLVSPCLIRDLVSRLAGRSLAPQPGLGAWRSPLVTPRSCARSLPLPLWAHPTASSLIWNCTKPPLPTPPLSRGTPPSSSTRLLPQHCVPFTPGAVGNYTPPARCKLCEGVCKRCVFFFSLKMAIYFTGQDFLEFIDSVGMVLSPLIVWFKKTKWPYSLS